MISGAQALMESLKREHVDHMFGYAGATICPAVDALAHTDIAYTLVRTEQNAGHMASGYARMTGKPGVCMVTSGPGATNLITGIATAYMDSIPLVVITSTLFVACMYAVLAFVAAGVLPVPEVGNSLVKVADHILPKALYYVFIIGGAGCALASTLNNQLATTPKPMMQMCDDGWLPAGLARVSAHGSPFIIQTFLYGMGAIALFAGLSVSTLVNLSIVAGGAMSILMNLGVMRLPKVCPAEWEGSKFKLPRPLLVTICVVAACATAFNVYVNASNLSLPLILLNVVVVTSSFVYGAVRSKHAHMQISYEGV